MNIKMSLISCSIALLAGTSAAMAGTTFASTGQASANRDFQILNTAGTVSVTASGQDLFTYYIVGTPFTPFTQAVLANFTLSATSIQQGACGSLTCPSGDSFTEQGFTGTFSYIVAGGAFAGKNLLSGTFSVNLDPTNSGGKLSSTVNGGGAAFAATQTLPANPNGIQMTSDFLDFTGVAGESGQWSLSGLIPNFSVNPTVNGLSKPTTGQTFQGSNVGTFSSEPAPNGLVPEPTSMILLGSALFGLGILGRKKLATVRP